MPAEKKRLTNTVIQMMKSGDMILDTEVMGLRARKRHAKRPATFEFRRQQHGIRHFATLGRWGELTVDEARDEARDLLRGIRHGETPADRRARNRMTMTTVKDLCECYLKNHGAVHLKPRTRETFSSNFRNVIYPAIGKSIVESITAVHVRRMHSRAFARTPAQANHAVRILSAIFSWAIKAGVLPHDLRNPCSGVETPRLEPRKRVLTPEEAKRLGKALIAAEGWADPIGLGAIWTMIVSGMRGGEVLSLRWDYIREDMGVIMLPDSKSGSKEVELTPVVQEVLAKLPRIAGSPWVFPSSNNPSEPRARVKRLWERIRKSADLNDVWLHDLRRSYISSVADAGYSMTDAQHLVGHDNIRTTQAYTYMWRGRTAQVAADIASKRANAFGLRIENNVGLKDESLDKPLATEVDF